MRNGTLPLNNKTLNLFRLKHLDPKDAYESVMLSEVLERKQLVKFEVIDAKIIGKQAWKQGIFVIKEFLWGAFRTLAKVTKKLCTKELSAWLEGFLACWLIRLNKNPGLRPRGVGAVFRKIIGKVFASAVRNDIISSVGLLKECAGHEAGCEVATNAMHTIFEDVKTEAVLLVDTANAIDSVNRQVFQHKIWIICPPIAPCHHSVYYWRNINTIIRRNHTGRPSCYVNICYFYNANCFNDYGNYFNCSR